VVSYTVIINVENRDGALLPGMTCAVEFIEDRREDALLVPNAALRYQPGGMAADEIAGMVFEAGLRGMDEAQRTAALEERSRAAGESPAGQTASRASSGLTGMMMPQRMPGTRGGRRMPPGSPGGAGRSGQVAAAPKPLWFINGNGKPDCVLALPGISDGSFTEILPLNEDLEGRQVIARERVQ
jgi:HlyD family secretion protein